MPCASAPFCLARPDAPARAMAKLGRVDPEQANARLAASQRVSAPAAAGSAPSANADGSRRRAARYAARMAAGQRPTRPHDFEARTDRITLA